LRYYYASEADAEARRPRLNLDEFVDKVNGDLVGKVVNLASRTARFVKTVGLSPRAIPRRRTVREGGGGGREAIATAYEACDYRLAMRLVMLLADRGQRVRRPEAALDAQEGPNARRRSSRTSCTVVLNLFRQIVDRTWRRCCQSWRPKAGTLLRTRSRRWRQSQRRWSARPSRSSST
jgi:methionyl-tRNA synthetase